MFYLYSDPDHSNDRYQPLAAPHLEGLAGQLIEINDRWGSADLSADYWSEVYWSNPDSFTLDDDEKEPEKREATEAIVLGIANSVWDTSHAHITGCAHHTDLNELAEFAAERCDRSYEGTYELLEEYIKQIENLEEKEIDDEAIADGDAEFLAICVEKSAEEDSGYLSAVEETRDDYDKASDLVDDKRQLFYAAIREAASEGVPRADIERAAELSESEIFKILRETE